MLRLMFDLRHLRRFRRSGRVLAVWLAYALAIQAVVAGVGAGMSAFAASGQPGFVICGRMPPPAPGPAGDHRGNGHGPNSVPPCPFCFVAAQTAGHFALTGAPPPVPAYAGLVIAAVADPIGQGAFVPRFRRIAGDPRAPPGFSV